MTSLNFQHLRYFWMVAKTGSIARASEQLNLTAHAISAQLTKFEENLGVKLFRPAGRNRELTEAGQSILACAEEIFAIGDELLDIVHDQKAAKVLTFRLGITASLSKSVAYRLVEPALKLGEHVKLVCREGRLSSLVAELAIHRLDMIIADQPMPATLNVRGYSHLLGKSSLTVFGTAALAAGLKGKFPAHLDNAPFLLPGEESTIRTNLIKWFETNRVKPKIVGEFDDIALIKSFGQAGVGLFVAPTATAALVCEQYKVEEIGRIDAVVEHLYAITTERRIKHPATLAISKSAKEYIFSDTAESESDEG